MLEFITVLLLGTIYGLIIDGHRGVKTIFDILNSEFKTALLNGGFKNLKEMNLKRIYFDK